MLTRERTYAGIRNPDLLIIEFLLGTGVGRFSTRIHERLGSRLSVRGYLRESSDPRESSRSHEGQVEFLERAQSGYGEAAGRILDGDHHSSGSRLALLHVDH